MLTSFKAFLLFDLYDALDFRFSILCFYERWTNDDNFGKKSLHQLRNYNVVHKIRNGRKRRVIYIFIHESLCYNIHKDLCMNNYDIESLAIGTENERSKISFWMQFTDNQNGDLKIPEVCFNEYFPKMEL